ncbi:hypothetical protein [Ghiorsea bivora]|uniref:hypothetical protein n=1 Tax=Ghiorsea bivora TaxID=1485545 RepID=UPI000571A558|nr:hypothetical protein [Ghiorsea bivora]
MIEFEGSELFDVPVCAANKKRNSKIKLGTDYPVFYAIKKLNEHCWSNNTVKQRAIEIYRETFNLNSRLEDDIDPSIYYADAYSTRDILLRLEKDNFLNLASLSNPSLFQISLIEYYQTELFKLFDQDTPYTRKLVKFVELMSGEREAGVRKNKRFEKQVSKPEVLMVPSSVNSEDGTGIQISYPQPESSQQKTLCRVAPKGGSKLTPSDDRLALRGRLNQQSSRNIISLIDMNRLTSHSISEYLKFLWSKHRTEFVFNLILFSTGLNPERLTHLKAENRPRLKSASECHFDKANNTLSYNILHQPKSKVVIELTPTQVMSQVLAQDKLPFKNSLDKSRKLAKKFHLHYPGQSPTAYRISASSALHFSCGMFNEMEVTYLSGDIPANFRAQSHYYPVDSMVINQKFQLCLQRFANNFGFTNNKLPPAYSESNETNDIGSTYAPPLLQLKKTLSEIYSATQFLSQDVQYINEICRLEHLVNFINLQHLQLFIIEQLSFCARRFGAKTSYANSTKFEKAWGSEKASPIFAIERKYIPTINLFNLQLEACHKTIQRLNELASYYRITCHIKFDAQENPLPIKLSFDRNLRLIKATRLNNKKFYDLLNDYKFTKFSDGIPERVNPFKHTVAAALLGKVPQVLLDELMNHDRDGLDFCAPWSTGSALSLELLTTEINTLFSKLDIKIIEFTGESHD